MTMGFALVAFACLVELACIVWLVACCSREKDRTEDAVQGRRRAYAALAQIANTDRAGVGGQMAVAAIRNATAESVDDHMAMMGITKHMGIRRTEHPR
jgi:hypothetical protein